MHLGFEGAVFQPFGDILDVIFCVSGAHVGVADLDRGG